MLLTNLLSCVVADLSILHDMHCVMSSPPDGCMESNLSLSRVRVHMCAQVMFIKELLPYLHYLTDTLRVGGWQATEQSTRK